MHRECYPDEHEGYEPLCGTGRRRPIHNEYLTDAFGAYQAFWLRQGEYWYDVVGRFVCGTYRAEDWGRDAARFWDGCMADYQRLLQFPHAKAQRGQVPSIVFVLDDECEAVPVRHVPVWFPVNQRTELDATPLQPIAGGSVGKAYLRAELDERGHYASVKLIQARSIPPGESHSVGVVHAIGSRRPVAVVHVVRRKPADSLAASGHATSMSAREPSPPTESQHAKAAASVESVASLHEQLPALEKRLQNIEIGIQALADQFVKLQDRQSKS
jgi:hypothetical protein